VATDLVKKIRWGWVALGLAFGCPVAEAKDFLPLAFQEAPSTFETLPQRSGKESSSLWEYFRERTKIGLGYEFVFDDNVLKESRARQQEDFISTLEAQIFFAGAKGMLDAQATYEVNAFRYHRLDANAINHDASVSFQWDPGGPWVYGLQYDLDVNNRLVITTLESGDLFRRSDNFQPQVVHRWSGDLSYAFSERDKVKLSASYRLTDDQTPNDQNTDRKDLATGGSWEHALWERWFLTTGYEFQDVEVPGNPARDASLHLAKVGLKYQIKEEAEIAGIFKAGRRLIEESGSSTETAFELNSQYPIPITPRWSAKLNYKDTRDISSLADRSITRRRHYQLDLLYELTPLVKLSGMTQYVKTQSIGVYALESGLSWQIRPKLSLTLKGRYERSKTQHYTDRQMMLEFTGEL
jgi:hypothetical protein